MAKRPAGWMLRKIKHALVRSGMDESQRSIAAGVDEAIERTATMLRAEYTVMPRFGFHQPLDYMMDTVPPDFAAPTIVPGEPLPLPPPRERMGYPADDKEYLEWGTLRS